MNDLFVTDKDSFEVSVYYTREGGRVKIRRPDSIKEEEKSSGQIKSLAIKFVVPTWTMSQEIMRTSTSYSMGRPHIDFGAFQGNLMRSLAQGWDVKDQDGKDVPFSLDQLGSLRPEIGRAIFEGLQAKLTELGIYDSILAS